MTQKDYHPKRRRFYNQARRESHAGYQLPEDRKKFNWLTSLRIFLGFLIELNHFIEIAEDSKTTKDKLRTYQYLGEGFKNLLGDIQKEIELQENIKK